MALIKGNTSVAINESTADTLRKLQAGDTVTLHLTPDGMTEAIFVTVNISATDVRKLLVRIEGHTNYEGHHANVIAQIFTMPDKLGTGYTELSYSE